MARAIARESIVIMQFKDYFSNTAEHYSQNRLLYPTSLFAFLANVTPSKALAWDCATGNGQAAIGVAEHFNSVVATDASSKQLQYAKAQRNIVYKVATAENCILKNHSVDLVTVASAVHWFNLERFYNEVRRVCRDGGILAIWIYDPKFEFDSRIDPLINDFISLIMPYFPEEAQNNWKYGYDWIDFPFKELTAPKFSTTVNWNADALLGYIYSWSGTQNYIEQRGRHDWDNVALLLRERWPSGDSLLQHERSLITRIGVCK